MTDLRPAALLRELADVWENESIDATSPERRATQRECVDTIRMLADMPRGPDVQLQPERAPTHRCTVCGAFWMEWSSGWSLCSKECGPCCDNSADFVDKLVPLIVSDMFTRATPPAPQEAQGLTGWLLPEHVLLNQFVKVWDKRTMDRFPVTMERLAQSEAQGLVPKLNAMVSNYADGHCWDHLDADVVRQAAALITAQASQLDEARDCIERLHRNFNLAVAGKPVRDAAETNAEVTHTLARIRTGIDRSASNG